MANKGLTTVKVNFPNGKIITCKASTNKNSPYFLSGELHGNEIFNAASELGEKTKVEIEGYGKFFLYQKSATWLSVGKTCIFFP